LIDASQVEWKDRAHFFAISANLMRRILVDYARSRKSRKRRGIIQRIDLNGKPSLRHQPDMDTLQLDRALKALAAFDPRGARVTELRFFGGLSTEETAEVLGVTPRTVKRDWAAAKVWLLKEMKRGEKG
jgi:RNA polymerase sigma factor (TIGR02999 family)